MTKLLANNNLRAFFIAAFGIVATYLVIVPKTFPYLGVSLSLIFLATLVFVYKSHKDKHTSLLYFFSVVLAGFISIRANPTVIFLDILAVFYLGAVMVTCGLATYDYSFFQLLVCPITAFFGTFTEPNKFVDWNIAFRSGTHVNTTKVKQLGSSVVLTLIILFFIVPLLSYANPFFEDLVQGVLDVFNLSNFLEDLFDAFSIPRLVLVVFLIWFVPKLLTLTNKSATFTPLPSKADGLLFLIPKVVVSIVLIIFFITQLKLYFASSQTLQTMGYSNSKQVNEVFAQLSVVSLIIFGLVYSDKRKSGSSRFFTYFLVVQTFFLMLVAFKSDFDYVSLWGFTHKRLWGFVVITWVLGAFGLFLYKYVGNLQDSFIFKHLILFTSGLLVAVNLLNFDYLIFHYAKSTTEDGIDHYYLKNLSTDAASYKAHVDLVIPKVQNSKSYERYIANELLYKIERLQLKYGHGVPRDGYNTRPSVEFRTFNLSEYLEYRRVKDVDVQKIAAYLDVLDNKPSSVPQISHYPQGSFVRIELMGLPASLYSAGYSIYSFAEDQYLTEGTLAANGAFTHFCGVGQFRLRVYDPVTGTLLETVAYEITEDDLNLGAKKVFVTQ